MVLVNVLWECFWVFFIINFSLSIVFIFGMEGGGKICISVFGIVLYVMLLICVVIVKLRFFNFGWCCYGFNMIKLSLLLFWVVLDKME